MEANMQWYYAMTATYSCKLFMDLVPGCSATVDWRSLKVSSNWTNACQRHVGNQAGFVGDDVEELRGGAADKGGRPESANHHHPLICF
jgi:hypothetical protein